MEQSQPYWVTIASAIGLSAIISTFVTHVLTSRWQHRVWINDNKKAEWRELLDEVNKSIEGMQTAFERKIAMTPTTTPQSKKSQDSCSLISLRRIN